uniref:Ig-like domain-containing protein n=1 Tax=Capra hircus TaxID=9925 RepID=A0A8C2RL65_CAPHI
MNFIPLFCKLFLTCSLFQPVLTQPASLSASPVTSARLSCTLSSGYNVGDFSLSWFQQKPGSPPWLTHSTSSGPSGVPGCFSGSISGNKAVLTIMGAQSEDEAVPYCATGAPAHHSLSLAWSQAGQLSRSPSNPLAAKEGLNF